MGHLTTFAPALFLSLFLVQSYAMIPSSIPNQQKQQPRRRRLTHSTHVLSPLADTAIDDKEMEEVGGISMSISELGEKLGGLGRAEICWDLYALGIDPADFFGNAKSPGRDNLLEREDYDAIRKQLPSSRRTQVLGKDALEKLASLYPNYGGRVEGGVATVSKISRSADRTTKLLLRLVDGLEVETVIIPWEGTRSTLCISSQVGCSQGCQFCATGKMGKLRSLTCDEILTQMFYAKKVCRLENLPRITNVVFMGLGEPSDNAENVVRATQRLTTNGQFQLR